MDRQQFTREFPEIESAFGSDFWSDAPDTHPINHNISRESSEFFDYLSSLVENSPAKKIVSQYKNNLQRESKFNSFLSEMVGFIATERWLCSDPNVLDVEGTSGLPEFECSEFDVEVSRELESTEVDRVRAHLQEQIGDNCFAIVEKRDSYDDYAGGNPEWEKNEDQVQDLLSKLGDVAHSELPLKIETEALRLEIKQADTDDVGYIGVTEPSAITPDRDGKIRRTICQKSNKQRETRSVVVFIDLDLRTVDTVDEVICETIGEPYSFAYPSDVKISPEIKDTDSTWDDYLKEIGAKTGHREAIPPGDEGVFANEEVSSIAGVMVRFYHHDVAYIPNVYTDEIDAKSIFDRLDWGTDTKSLGPSEI
ncbi:hypothetical protein [Halobaculum sp. MBLA0143]|uniref:hypothetical protein n=1 Tax=Halobaculum sp. MBLA0143 TaxID=3079933 RepID=UPI003525839C